MSKVGYTEMSLGKALQYEHRIKVNDFVRVLKQKGEIRTNLLEVFPDLKVEFVIRMLAETCTVNDVQYQYNNVGIYNKQNQLQLHKKPGDLFFFIEIENVGVEEAKLAGEVKIDMDGKVETIKLGDVEKMVFQAFTKSKLLIDSGKSVRRTHPTTNHQEIYPGVFIYNADGGWQDEAVNMELVFSLHHPGVLLRSQEVSVPKSLRSQETLPAVTKSIMLDEATADLTVRCDTKTFRVHKTFLCSRYVLVDLHLSLLAGLKYFVGQKSCCFI